MTGPDKKRISYETAPAPGDILAWSGIAGAGCLSSHRDADVLEAWDAIRGVDSTVATKLERHLSDRIERLLAKWLGNRNYGRDHDLWTERRQDILVAMYQPMSEAGRAIRKGFVTFVNWGTIDAIRADQRRNPGHVRLIEATTCGGGDTDALDRTLDLQIACERFSGDDRRKMICIAMDGMGFTRDEIRAKTGVSDRTQREWLAGFRAYKSARGIG